jgi:hypothetical protein
LVASEPWSTQVSPHFFVVPVQESSQTPALQAWLGAQAVPQAPQWRVSLLTSTHSLVPAPVVHEVLPAAHVALHVPPLQTCPSAQTVPHCPQLRELDCVSTHKSPHATSPTPQLKTHLPASQEAPMPQRKPQVPQLLSSLFRSTQALLQNVWVGAQDVLDPAAPPVPVVAPPVPA